MKKCIRHGDLCLVEIDKLPEGLKETESKVIMTGSGGNDHTFKGGKLYLKNVSQFAIGYLVGDKTILYHIEHGKIVKNSKLRETYLADKVYELRKQHEIKHTGMMPVID